MHEIYKSRPKGTRGLGNLGDGVDPDFVMSHGSRAQRRALAKHLRQQDAKEKAKNSGGGKKRNR